jgi:hypothetical protein
LFRSGFDDHQLARKTFTRFLIFLPGMSHEFPCCETSPVFQKIGAVGEIFSADFKSEPSWASRILRRADFLQNALIFGFSQSPSN